MSRQPDEQTEQQQIQELRQAIVKEEETQSVLQRVLSLLKNKTRRQMQTQDQQQIKKIRGAINQSN